MIAVEGTPSRTQKGNEVTFFAKFNHYITFELLDSILQEEWQDKNSCEGDVNTETLNTS